MVAEHFGMDHATLRYQLKKSGVKTRSRSEAIKNAAKEGRYDNSGENNPNYRHGKKCGAHRGFNGAAYGLSEDGYNKLLHTQGLACAICKEQFSKRPHIDHCHLTGRVRGLLCHNCNTAIGLLKDSTENLANAISYLEG